MTALIFPLDFFVFYFFNLWHCTVQHWHPSERALWCYGGHCHCSAGASGFPKRWLLLSGFLILCFSAGCMKGGILIIRLLDFSLLFVVCHFLSSWAATDSAVSERLSLSLASLCFRCCAPYWNHRPWYSLSGGAGSVCVWACVCVCVGLCVLKG